MLLIVRHKFQFYNDIFSYFRIDASAYFGTNLNILRFELGDG